MVEKNVFKPNPMGSIGFGFWGSNPVF